MDFISSKKKKKKTETLHYVMTSLEISSATARSIHDEPPLNIISSVACLF